jgi:hypothetical protein
MIWVMALWSRFLAARGEFPQVRLASSAVVSGRPPCDQHQKLVRLRRPFFVSYLTSTYHMFMARTRLVCSFRQYIDGPVTSLT